MQTLFYDLVEIFGISSYPETFVEVLPWMCQVFLAFGFLFFVLNMLKSWVLSFIRAANRW